tara:strand:+ start:901 stop:1626 length:726 start_codon:yes stop_codon:yes gene_type:complete
MAEMKELTRKIQRLVGSSADGIYGKNTANAILRKLQEKATHPLDELMAPAPKKVKVSFWSKLFASITKQVPTKQVPIKQDVTTTYSEVYKSTPNKSVRKIVPEGVILHHSYGSYEGGVSWILNDDSDVSYHVLIDTDGSRTVFAKDNERAWHAGTSEFNGRYGCNGFMIGLAFSNDTETRELTDAEVASAVEFMLPRFDKWGWPKDLSTITTHRAVAPNRKVDVDVRAEDKILKALAKAIK